ncbi:MAG: hypothetical protein EOM64_04725 [Erysipelotrichia bacterium]|nr:hypothetical protein [Erysipelotrichia bacterium]
MRPMRLKPVYKDTIWANDHLSTIRGLDDHQMGIARELCAYKGSENEIADGEYAGRKISDAIQEHHFEMLGSDPNNQLLRVAYMDSKDTLSIQVHPNEKQAKAVGDYEKSESWYILEAEPDASIVAGIDCSDRKEICRAAKEGDLEKYLIRHPVKSGDFVLIPAGLVHANGAGMLVVEIGSFGGITYRLYDFGRGRELNLDQAAEVMNPELRTEVTHHPLKKCVSSHIETGVDCNLFHVDIADISSEMTIEPQGYYYELICVHGSCLAESDGEAHRLNYTDTLFVPASAAEVKITGNCRILVAHYKA